LTHVGSTPNGDPHQPIANRKVLKSLMIRHERATSLNKAPLMRGEVRLIIYPQDRLGWGGGRQEAISLKLLSESLPVLRGKRKAEAWQGHLIGHSGFPVLIQSFRTLSSQPLDCSFIHTPRSTAFSIPCSLNKRHRSLPG